MKLTIQAKPPALIGACGICYETVTMELPVPKMGEAALLMAHGKSFEYDQVGIVCLRCMNRIKEELP